MFESESNLMAVAGLARAVLVAVLIVSPHVAYAADATALAKQTQNPIASLISLPLQNNTNFGVGPEDKTQNVLNIQPVWPFAIGENWNLITRTILPVISQPAAFEGQSRENGIGDLNFTGFFSPQASGSLTWGVGPTIVAPTASDDRLGNDHWRLGASFVGLATPGRWVFGALVSNVWSVGSSDDPDVMEMLIQPFINYNIPDSGGLYLVSAPIWTANWEAESSGDRWTLPIGGGVGKIFKLGKQPMNAQVQAFYNVATPEFGARWQLRLQLQWLFPK